MLCAYKTRSPSTLCGGQKRRRSKRQDLGRSNVCVQSGSRPRWNLISSPLTAGNKLHHLLLARSGNTSVFLNINDLMLGLHNKLLPSLADPPQSDDIRIGVALVPPPLELPLHPAQRETLKVMRPNAALVPDRLVSRGVPER
jgi:hypothetical protein